MPRAILSALMIASLAVAGCDSSTGTSDNFDTPCTITITGAAAIAGTYTCPTPVTVWAPTSNTGAVTVNISGSKSITGVFAFTGQPQAGTTYNSANSSTVQSYGFIVTSGSASWEFTAGQQFTPLGSGTMTLSSVAVIASNINGTVYSVHGTMDVNLVPGPGTTATGNATMHVVF